MPIPVDACVCIYFIDAGALDILLSACGHDFIVTPAILGEFRRPATRTAILSAVQAGKLAVQALTPDEQRLADQLQQPGANPKLGAGEASLVAMIRMRGLVGATEDEDAVTHIRRDPGDGYWIGVRELLVDAIRRGTLPMPDAQELCANLRNMARCPRLNDFRSLEEIL